MRGIAYEGASFVRERGENNAKNYQPNIQEKLDKPFNNNTLFAGRRDISSDW